MSNIDFGWQMLGSALQNLNQSAYRRALGTGLSPFAQDQSNDPGAVPAVNPGGQPDKLSPGSAASMLARAKFWAPKFAPIAEKYGVPLDRLMSVAAQESGFNPVARGPTGDFGMFQFTGPTARLYGLTNPNDPMASADAAARLLRENYRKTGSWDAATAAYNTGLGNYKSAAGARYLASVNRFMPMFSGLGGTGGTPSSSGVAGAPGGGRTADAQVSSPPPPLPRERPEQAGDIPQATPSSDSDVAVADQPIETADQRIALRQQLQAARIQRGLKPLSDQEADRMIDSAGSGNIQRMLNPPQPAPPPAPPRMPQPPSPQPIPTGDTQPSPRGDEIPFPTQPSAMAPARPTPPIRSTAGRGPDQPPPGPTPTGVARGAPGPAPPVGHPSVDPSHPAHSPAEMAKADKADPANPPAGPPLNENGFFPYTSVWGKGFTLPQLIYNIKKANPGINPAVLAGAVLLAQPMLNSAATEHVRDYQESMREYMETQREAAAQKRVETQQEGAGERAQLQADTRLKIASSLEAYRNATLNLRKEQFDERIREFAIKDDEAQRALFDKEEKMKADIEDRRKALTQRISAQERAAAARDLSNLLTQRRDLERQIHNAVSDKIRLATSLAAPDQATQDQLTADEEKRAAKAKKEMDEIEARIRKAGFNRTGIQSGG